MTRRYQSPRCWIDFVLFDDDRESPEDDDFSVRFDRGEHVAGDVSVSISGKPDWDDNPKWEVNLTGFAHQIVYLATEMLTQLDIAGGHPLPETPYETYPALSQDVIAALRTFVDEVRAYDARLTDGLNALDASGPRRSA